MREGNRSDMHIAAYDGFAGGRSSEDSATPGSGQSPPGAGAMEGRSSRQPTRDIPPAATGVRYRSADDCPDAASHTPHPIDYGAHADWAERKLKTHTQHRCPTCGFWAIWKPKRKAGA